MIDLLDWVDFKPVWDEEEAIQVGGPRQAGGVDSFDLAVPVREV